MNNNQETIAVGLAGRLRSLAIVLDRLDRLESGSGVWLTDFKETELSEAAQMMTLRAFKTVSDPANYTILRALASGESHKVGDLITMTGNGRLPLSEHLNDLVQVGLASRLIDTDHAQITAAGAAFVELIDEIAGKTVTEYLG